MKKIYLVSNDKIWFSKKRYISSQESRLTFSTNDPEPARGDLCTNAS